MDCCKSKRYVEIIVWGKIRNAEEEAGQKTRPPLKGKKPTLALQWKSGVRMKTTQMFPDYFLLFCF
jgi:hypothetical protein